MLRVLVGMVLGVVFACVPVQAQEIAFTFDDLPAHSALPQGTTRVEIAEKILTALKDAKMPPVYGFINGIQTEKEPASEPVLKMWRKAGYPLGNHTWSHTNLNQNSLEAWQADLLKNEPLLEKLGGDWHWLRYPNLAEGDTPQKRHDARFFLADHGYKIAGVTTSFHDYLWNAPYARCIAKHDDAAIAELEASYLQAAEDSIRYSLGLAHDLYGHDVPLVLLMHLGAMDARMLPRLLDVYKRHGFKFITLEEAEKDEFYKNDLEPRTIPVPDTLEEAAKLRGTAVEAPKSYAQELDAVCR